MGLQFVRFRDFSCLVPAAVVVAGAFFPSAALAQSQIQTFDLAAQPAAAGVRAFARQANIEIVLASSAASGRRTNAVQGQFEVRRALDRLAAGTGLSVRSFDGKVAVLVASDGAEVAQIEDVVVTGSRIPRPELVNPMPVSVTRMDEALALGRISVADALARDPVMGVGQNLGSASTGWDAGISAVDLRNLGVNRSLTLIDGKRRVSSSARSSAVDVGMIPVGMVDRVEVITGGAAAVYGADAVTGAVNIITKRDIEGVNLSATTGISGEGDAGEHLISASTGGRFADGRGRFVIGGSWSQTDSLLYVDRFGMQNFLSYRANLANTGINDGIPDRIINEQTRQMYYDYKPTFWHAGQRWYLEDAGVRKGECGVMTDMGQYSVCDGGDGRHLQDVLQFRGGNTAISLLGRASYDLDENTEIVGYFSYAGQEYEGFSNYWRDDSRTTYFSGNGTQPRGSIAYLDNPFLPDGLRDYMTSNNLDSLYIDRTFGNFPMRGENHDRDSVTFGAEINGRFNDRINWTAFAQHGRVRDDYTQSNIPWKSHWIAARDVVADANGDPVCRDITARNSGCVPLNIFSLEAPSQELLDYAMADRNERRVNTQTLAGVTVDGVLFDLPAGELGFAAGVEYRKDTLKTRDDPLALSGELVYGGGPAAHPELDAETDVKEVYAELLVPVLSNMTLANHLDLELAYRYSDYSTVGGTDSWKAGLFWEPIGGLAVRGVRSRSVRTPNFGELYEAQINTMTGSIDDPCEVASYFATEQRAANCLALGITDPLLDYKIGPVVTTGGNPDLAPETSDSTTFGVVWRPDFLQSSPYATSFDLSVDYWDIDIENVITQFGYATLMKLCVDAPSIDNPYCARIDRDPVTHEATAVRSNQLNAARMHARGIDLGTRYRVALGEGEFRAGLKATRLLDMVTETTPGIASGDVEYAGGYKNPDWRATLTLDYELRDFTIGWNVQHRSSSVYDLNTDSDEAYPDGNTVDAITYHDLVMNYRFGDRYQIGFGVKNVFDTYPQFKTNVYRDNETYDLVGRYFFLTAKAAF